ncbi:hypothetical protein BCR44DRAFT_1426667, partial [Catenaria anguillulae PL171]
ISLNAFPAMTSKVSKYTIVVAVLEGRHFPRRSGASVYVQCKFNGEQLSTDPVLIGNLGAPMWDTELAWDLDAQIWAPLIPPPAAEVSSSNWLSSTTNGPRPELKISFGSGPQGSDLASVPSAFPRPASPSGMLSSHHASPQKPGTGTNNSVIHAPPPAPRHISTIAASASSLASLQIAQQPDGAYRVGTDSSTDRMFRLAITLVSVCDLTLLAGYFALMHLLGNELRTQSFTDPKAPAFPEETLTLDLVVGSSDIETLIRSLDKLPVHLCYDEQILGVAQLISHECLLDVIEDSTVDLKIPQRPKLALRVALTELPTPQHLDLLMNPTASNPAATKQGPNAQDEAAQRLGSPAHLLSVIENAVSTPSSPNLATKPNQPVNALPSLPELPGVPIHVPSTISALRKEYEQEHNVHVQQATISADLPTMQAPPTTGHNLSNGASSAPQGNASANNRWHQYRFSIDIKAARDLQPPWHSANVFFKYAYGPFGTRSPFLSHPPILLSRNSAPTEVLLTSGFCAYEFVMAPSRLRLFLDALPLEIFAVHKDVMAKDTVLGAALVDLGRPLQVQVVDHWVNVCASAPSGSVVKVLAIRVILCLEDFGPIEEQHVPAAAASGAIGLGPASVGAGESVDAFANSITIPPSVTVGEDAFMAGNRVPRYPPSTAAATPATPYLLDPTTVPPPAASSDPTTTASSQQQQQERLLWERAQQQVDEWRQRQEQRIELAIRERDAAAMKELESRLKSRESELDKKAAEYREVELHLERLLADMERREQALQREEQDLIDRKVEMEREFEARCAKVEDTARRLDADVRQRNEAVAEKAEWERNSIQGGEDVRGAPEARELQVQLKEATEKVDASEKRAAVYKKQRAHFKQQWLKTLAEYAQFKRDAEQAKLAAEADFQKRLVEAQAPHSGSASKQAASQVLPNVVVPGKAETGGAATHVDAEELQRIRAELNELRETHEQFKQSILGATINSASGGLAHPHQQPRPGAPIGRAYVAETADGRTSGLHSVHGSQFPPPHSSLPRDQLVQLERIIQERDLLLRSGVYTVNDHLIREMNARIQQLEMS